MSRSASALFFCYARGELEQLIGVAVREFLQIGRRQFERIEEIASGAVAAVRVIDREHHAFGAEDRKQRLKRRQCEQAGRGHPDLVEDGLFDWTREVRRLGCEDL